MKQIIIRRLFQSFVELEEAIGKAKTSINKEENPSKDVLHRIHCYEEMLSKQRALATTLCGHAALGEWDEVARHIKLINGLSLMIRDDAREIVHPPRTVEQYEERDAMVC